MLDPQWQQVRNLLLVRLDNLGDVLLATPAFRAIRECLPEARLTLLASPVGAQVAPLNPDLDDVIIYQSPQMDPWMRLPQDSQREQEVIALLRERHFDAAIIFTSFRQSPLSLAYLCYLADIPLRLAASVEGSGSLLTTRHRHPERLLMHEVERGLALVGAVGFATRHRDLVLEVPSTLRAEVRSRLAEDVGGSGRPLVLIHPGCSMPARTYPWEMYAEVADLLVSELGCRVLFTGTAEEVELVERIRARMRHHSSSLAGQTDFARLAAVIAEADLLVTNNTGPMHVAAAVKTPVVALFALTNPPQQWGPWRVPHRQLYHIVPCAICYMRVCPVDHGCLRKVSPQQVREAVAELLEETKVRRQGRS